MLKHLRAFFSVGVVCILFAGCIEITETVQLKKDGTGNYGIKIDMGKLFEDPMMKSMLEGSEKKNDMENIDSMIYFKNLPDSAIKDNPELWSRAKMHLVTKTKDKMFFVEVDFDFKNLDEIAYFSANYNKVMDASKANPLASTAAEGEGPKQPDFLANGLSYRLKGKTLERLSTASPAVKEPEGEELEMMKSFLSNAVYKLELQLPGKVVNSTFPNSKIEGSKLTTQVTFVELMEKKKDVNGKVKFK